MAAGRTRGVEDKDEPPLEEAMPVVIHAGIGQPFDLMRRYLNDDICVTSSPYVNGKRLTIFGRDSAAHIYRQTVAIARDHVLTAGPLDALAAEVEKNRNVLLPTVNITIQIDGQSLRLSGTLEQLAIIVLDRTIKTDRDFEDKGCAETLRELRAELLPDTIPQALKQASFATSFEDKTTEEKRRSAELAILNQAFNLIKANKPGAHEIVRNYIKSTQPSVITDNKYFFKCASTYSYGF